MSQRIGIGYDIHRLVEGRKLILGGIEIPYERGLDGHSDADVLIHAICDAILGALGKGDIGEHFPNNDARYKDISSKILLEKVKDLVVEDGFVIGNIDCVMQMETPSIRDYKQKMRVQLARILAVKEERINIKATTLERLGALGKGEGIAAFAAVLLTR